MDFADKRLWKETNGVKLYTSASLEQIWPYGFSTIGDVTLQSAAYIARYVMKKIHGPNSDRHYEGRTREFSTMSNGLGLGWFKKYQSDVYPDDFIVIEGKKKRVPRYYDVEYQKTHPDEFDLIKEARIQSVDKFEADNTPERLVVREIVQMERFQLLHRYHDKD